LLPSQPIGGFFLQKRTIATSVAAMTAAFFTLQPAAFAQFGGFPGNSSTNPPASCSGISRATYTQAQKSAQTQVCNDAAEFALGQQGGSKALRKAAKTIFNSLVTQFNLPVLCAASIAAVMAQQVVDGNLSAGSCTP
jgi:hypothetical protein